MTEYGRIVTMPFGFRTSPKFQLRICITGHTSAAGHRGREATEIVVRRNFFWSTLTTDISTFVKSCIHFLCITIGAEEPRRFVPVNDRIQFDYIEMVLGEMGCK